MSDKNVRFVWRILIDLFLRDDRTIKDRRKYIYIYFQSKTVENRFQNFYSYYCEKSIQRKSRIFDSFIPFKCI